MNETPYVRGQRAARLVPRSSRVSGDDPAARRRRLAALASGPVSNTTDPWRQGRRLPSRPAPAGKPASGTPQPPEPPDA